MVFITYDRGFKMMNGDKIILSHDRDRPMIYVGYGEESLEMYRGNFTIKDYTIERYPLKNFNIIQNEYGYELDFEERIKAVIKNCGELFTIEFIKLDHHINRFWFRVNADEEEKCYGCGEQMSYFNLRGRNFPIWTSEPGVGRDKTTYITWRSDVDSKAGGDYYHTNFPQPTYISTRHYYLHVDSTAYADFNFRHKNYHEIEIWEVPRQIRIETASTFINLLEKLTGFLGRQPKLPDWIYDGAIIGVQGGTKRVFSLADRSIRNGMKVIGIWCQDWQGKRDTSFGRRLQWNWKWNEELYPGLPEMMKKYKEKGIRFLGYINPYLVKDGDLYKEGIEKGYFVLSEEGDEYLIDFGEFFCGAIDLTNSEAYDWFKEIIKKYLIQFGLDGWMADFGEYLPIDIKLHNKASAMTQHNLWPVLWAKCNYDALLETGKLEEVIYFMRAGGAGSQKYCPLLWAGDQSVDFSIHDGLASVIVGALSSGMSGCGLHHSDIGGYTSLYGTIRTKEVFLRWAEMAIFTPFMRTHEGNRPDENFQYYDDADTMEKFSRMIDIHISLKVYIKMIVEENSRSGIPVQRPLFLHYEHDEYSYNIQTEYLFGRDLLIAPVYLADKKQWEVYLPKDQWIHLWSGTEYCGGNVIVDAPIGYTPVFYRKDSIFIKVFNEIRDTYGI